MPKIKMEIRKGDTFNNLTIISEIEKSRQRKFLCKCSCGNEKEVQLSHLRSGCVKSCGCLRGKQNITHGLSKNKLYTIWLNMRARCNNENHKSFKDYGGRGIKTSKEWENFEIFYANMKPTYKDGLQIERINNDMGYNKNNCKWATRKEQARNRRSTKFYKGKCYSEWAEELGINRSNIPRLIKLNKI